MINHRAYVAILFRAVKPDSQAAEAGVSGNSVF
jgi:hypothetical protein